ncbi:Uncharacterised protein [uncultured archaeon]|nr:Uncharacterised protein [uncultured archaeon]
MKTNSIQLTEEEIKIILSMFHENMCLPSQAEDALQKRFEHMLMQDAYESIQNARNEFSTPQRRKL